MQIFVSSKLSAVEFRSHENTYVRLRAITFIGGCPLRQQNQIFSSTFRTSTYSGVGTLIRPISSAAYRTTRRAVSTNHLGNNLPYLSFSNLIKALENPFHPFLTGLLTAATASICLIDQQTFSPNLKPHYSP
jgi:hypothetical protein